MKVCFVDDGETPSTIFGNYHQPSAAALVPSTRKCGRSTSVVSSVMIVADARRVACY